MLDPKQLLGQVLGGGSVGGLGNLGSQVKGGLDSLGGTGGFAGGAAVGGLLGMLLGGKKGRKMAGGMLGYGGAAAVGALAMHAYQAYKRGQTVQSTVPMSPSQVVTEVQNTPQAALPHSKPASDGSPFELVLVRAMVGAAKADGHVDANEQRKLFSEVERMGLDAESKAYVFDLLSKPADLDGITSCVSTPEQAAELYLASRLAIDPDEPSERAYLDALAGRLKLPSELRAHLDLQSAQQVAQ